MTFTFENNNDIIIYALEKIIDYAKNIRYILVVQSVWWIASIIGREKDLATFIYMLYESSEAPVKELARLSLLLGYYLKRIT